MFSSCMYHDVHHFQYCVFIWRARVCWPLLCLCRPFFYFFCEMSGFEPRELPYIASRSATNFATHLPLNLNLNSYIRKESSWGVQKISKTQIQFWNADRLVRAKVNKNALKSATLKGPKHEIFGFRFFT
jgi:hypothetical protein